VASYFKKSYANSVKITETKIMHIGFTG